MLVKISLLDTPGTLTLRPVLFLLIFVLDTSSPEDNLTVKYDCFDIEKQKRLKIEKTLESFTPEARMAIEKYLPYLPPVNKDK